MASFILVAMLSIAMIAFFSSARLHDRVVKASNEFQEWAPSKGKATPENSSTGVRLDFYTNTLKIVQHNLLLVLARGVSGGVQATGSKQGCGSDAESA
jgi:hypothetical protein